MSTLQTKTVRLGDSATLANNFELSVPPVPDGTFKIRRQDGTEVFRVLANGTVEFANAPRLILYGSGGEGGEIAFRNAANSTTAAFVDVDPNDDFRIFSNLSNKSIKFFTNSAERMLVRNTGRVEVLANEQPGTLYVNGNIVARSGNSSPANSINGYTFTNDQDSGMFNPVDGQLWISVNNSRSQELLSVAGGAKVTMYRNGGTFYNDANLELQSLTGDVYLSLHAVGASAGVIRHTRVLSGFDILDATNAYAPLRASAFTVSSDYRIKENVTPLVGAIDRLMGLRPCRFNYTADSPMPKEWDRVDGFIAHEAAEVVPDAVSGKKDAVDDEGKPILQSMDNSRLVPLLVASIQELKASLDTAMLRIAELEAK